LSGPHLKDDYRNCLSPEKEFWRFVDPGVNYALLQATWRCKCTMPELQEVHDAPSVAVISVTLIGPDEPRRKAIASALAKCPGVRVQEISSYPADVEDIPKMLEEHHDVVIVDLDGDPELALNVVESICDNGSRTVMVFSEKADHELVGRCMRAGAREFLVLPITAVDMADALARITVRLPESRPAKRKVGHLLVFLGAKGGCGVTTIASNFAILLAQESGEKTLLIDLGIPLGDVAINLGIVAKYSTHDAFQDSSRLDTNFLSSLLTEHSSGLFVLTAPGEFSRTEVTAGAVDKLLAVARKSFDYVVVDAGYRHDLKDSGLFDTSATAYLVTQIGVSELRNSNRLISQFFSTRGSKLQIVLNRYTPKNMLFDEEHITKALTRPAQWRIPNDYAAARRTRHAATPLALENSPISKVIRQMARKACGLLEKDEKKKGFSFFGRAR
jgi:pilus assembly protein CpaE